MEEIMGDSDNLIFARSLRSQWRDEEEEITSESFEYAKRNTSYIEYLASIQNEGYSINISTQNNSFEGYISFIGTNFFSIRQKAMSKKIVITSFPLVNANNIVFSLGKKNKNTDMVLGDSIKQKSFKALLDEISDLQITANIELLANKELSGKLYTFKDFYSITNGNIKSTFNLEKDAFIKEDSTLIKHDAIVAISVIEE
jgi:hypothetical protein